MPYQWLLLFNLFDTMGNIINKGMVVEEIQEPSYIPHDVIIEILSSLPVEDLLRSFEIQNMAIRQTLVLPEPCYLHYTVGVTFFYVRSTGEYKVVNVHCAKHSENGKTRVLYCEVFTVGDSTNSWRPLHTPISIEFYETIHYPVVFTGGTVHFLRFVEIDHGSYRVKEIISLDVESECFTTSIFPQEYCFSNLNNVRIMDWNECLSFVEIVGDKMSVLVLEDCEKQKWSKKLVIVLRFMEEKNYKGKKPKPLIARHGKLWFRLSEMELIYDMKSERTDERIFHVPYIGSNHGSYNILVPSLVTLKGMRPEKDQCESNLQEEKEKVEENLKRVRKTMKNIRKRLKKKAKRKLAKIHQKFMRAVVLLLLFFLFWIGSLYWFFYG
ncbi:hypothetical protein HHK36_023828 [Tetracentron sinense]|uniref:F-box associated beta-propeller type 3 domain-containing protein n=1 Tax=Tetracentron sinense TaxID=13715 RepID=A0A834YRU8_TETSI|nr:hypothetical protein HHK36_023828 [Tetracentron sinense]